MGFSIYGSVVFWSWLFMLVLGLKGVQFILRSVSVQGAWVLHSDCLVPPASIFILHGFSQFFSDQVSIPMAPSIQFEVNYLCRQDR